MLSAGHGIGNLFHTTPNIPHYKKNKAVGIMKPGHTFTVRAGGVAKGGRGGEVEESGRRR
eukprot:654124-Hanusia_phi.AAC.1